MPHSASDPKEHAHELIDRMAPAQVSAVVGLLEMILDPFARAIAGASLDDEPVAEEEGRQIAESQGSSRGDSIRNEEVLAEFGLTTEDFDRMGRTPLESHGTGQ